MTLRLPDPCLVVLVGATGAGKSAWAHAWFHGDQIVSSDRLRAVVGAGERDQRASRDAFELLDLIVAKRLRRGLTTVVDTTGLEPKRRAAWRALAEREGVPAHAVVLDAPEKVVRERNRARGTPVPPKVVAAQLREAATVFATLGDEGFAGVHAAGPVELVPPGFLDASAWRAALGLQPGRVDHGGQPAGEALRHDQVEQLERVAARALVALAAPHDRAQPVGGDDLVGLEPRPRPVRLPRRRRADQHDEARIRQPHS